MTGGELKSLLKGNYQLDCDNFKLIYNGKLIKDDISLIAQDLKVNLIILFKTKFNFNF